MRKTAYIRRHILPTRLSNLNLLSANAKYNKRSEESSEIALYSIPAEFMPTCKICQNVKTTAMYVKFEYSYPVLVFNGGHKCSLDEPW